MGQNILITGGAGYIGSHTVKMLKERGYTPVVYDNLCAGTRATVKGAEFIKGDIGDFKKLTKIFAARKIRAVIHFAAFINVAESVKKPSKYYENNVSKAIILLEAMRAAKIKYFVFSSSAAVYGNGTAAKIAEDHPKNPLNPYGQTKLMLENILKDYDKAYNLKSITLRYFNACGGKEAHKPETHLIPLILQTAAGRRKAIKIFGMDYPTKDGTAVRDYVHVNDLADAHILALQYLLKKNKSDDFNLGTGRGFTVKEIISAAGRITGKKIKTAVAPRRAGDPAVLVADGAKAARVLGWRAQADLDKIIETSWQRE